MKHVPELELRWSPRLPLNPGLESCSELQRTRLVSRALPDSGAANCHRKRTRPMTAAALSWRWAHTHACLYVLVCAHMCGGPGWNLTLASGCVLHGREAFRVRRRDSLPTILAFSDLSRASGVCPNRSPPSCILPGAGEEGSAKSLQPQRIFFSPEISLPMFSLKGRRKVQ